LIDKKGTEDGAEDGARVSNGDLVFTLGIGYHSFCDGRVTDGTGTMHCETRSSERRTNNALLRRGHSVFGARYSPGRWQNG